MSSPTKLYNLVVDILTMTSSFLTDTISEYTAGAGVTIDGVLLKDGAVTPTALGGVVTDVIAERTAAAGVTIDGCLIKDGYAAGIATANMFLSAEVTGTGSSQNTAHSLGTTPRRVIAMISTTNVGADVVAYGAHDATNCIFTVTSGCKYYILAFK